MYKLIDVVWKYIKTNIFKYAQKWFENYHVNEIIIITIVNNSKRTFDGFWINEKKWLKSITT